MILDSMAGSSASGLSVVGDVVGDLAVFGISGSAVVNGSAAGG